MGYTLSLLIHLFWEKREHDDASHPILDYRKASKLIDQIIIYIRKSTVTELKAELNAEFIFELNAELKPELNAELNTELNAEQAEPWA